MNVWIYICLTLLAGMAVKGQPPRRHELLMTEILADPSPSVGLPSAEFVEIRNVSQRTLRLDGCRLSDGVSGGTIGTGIQLEPDSLLILCSRSFAGNYATYGRTLGLSSFPAIDNDGESLLLISPEGVVIHAMQFDISYYGNPLKAAGGWSLEMIDHRFPCHGSENWAPSMASDGGTPGRANSMAGTRSDLKPPALLRTFAVDSLTIVAVFDEGLDSVKAAGHLQYSLEGNGPKIVSARPLSPFFDRVQLVFDRPLAQNVVYTLQVSAVSDCHGNPIRGLVFARTGRPDPVRPGQLRINEILFDPKPEAADFVELLNLGPGIINANSLYLGNCSGTGITGNLKRIREDAGLIFPGDLIVCTTDPLSVKRAYFVKEPDWLWKMDAMPSYPDESGCVVVLDSRGRELDRLVYRAEMHFPLIGEKEGVSLERVNPSASSEMPENWHSAGSGVGYGTPTGRNSQFMQGDTVKGTVGISPTIFSPDMDGVEDLLTISWQFPVTGNLISLRILDSQGRLIRTPLRNGLAGTNGEIRWNGLNERGTAISSGLYFLWAEATDTRGKQRVWRIPFVLARRQ
jgi:hypothetical protein